MNSRIMKLNIFTFKIFFMQLLLIGAISLSPIVAFANTNNNFSVRTYYAIPSDNNLLLKGRVSYPPKNTRAWFRWGDTPYMEYSTTPVRLSYISYMRNIDLPKTISNVKKNTTYYYQIVAEKADGSRTYGERLSTNTGWVGKDSLPNTETTTTNNTNVEYYNTIPSPTSPIAVTLLPSFINTTSVQLKGLALPGNTIQTDGWFEFGTTKSLGRQTAHKNITNNARSIKFSVILSGINPDTIYYYRAVIKNTNGISYGNILSLKTNKQYTVKIYNQIVNTTKKYPTYAKKKTKEVVRKKHSSLTASVVGSSSKFIPNTLIEWLALLLIILAILALSDHLYITRKRRKEESKDK